MVLSLEQALRRPCCPTLIRRLINIKLNQALTLGRDGFAELCSEQIDAKLLAVVMAKAENAIVFGDKMSLQLPGNMGENF